jgi:magnesium chelatase subunit D
LGKPVNTAMTPSTIPEIERTPLEADGVYRMARQRAPQLNTASGRRKEPVLSFKRGKYARFRLPKGPTVDIAMDASLRAAAGRCLQAGDGFKVEPGDLREKIRRHRSPFNIAFVVDNSWSMHVERTLEKTKGMVLELLEDAHLHRDKVAMIAFRHNRRPQGAICLPMTKSRAFASERLANIPISGTTPLPDAMHKALKLLGNERLKTKNALPVMVVITDGLPNIPMQKGADAFEEIYRLCRHLPWEGIWLIVVDTQPKGAKRGQNCCEEMARLAKGKYMTLEQMTRRSLARALAAGQLP